MGYRRLVVTFSLKELGDQTEFTLTHGGWKQPDDILSKANQKSSTIRDTMNNGWKQIVHVRLKQVVEG